MKLKTYSGDIFDRIADKKFLEKVEEEYEKAKLLELGREKAKETKAK